MAVVMACSDGRVLWRRYGFVTGVRPLALRRTVGLPVVRTGGGMEIEVDGFRASWTPESGSVEVIGEIDLATVPAFSKVLDEVLTVGNRPVKLDMHAVTFVDASLPRALVRAQKTHQSRDRRPVIEVVRASGVVRRVLGLVDLERFLAQ
jgi:anti-anti-sigma factor